jgi:hypothetical protein
MYDPSLPRMNIRDDWNLWVPALIGMIIDFDKTAQKTAVPALIKGS